YSTVRAGLERLPARVLTARRGGDRGIVHGDAQADRGSHAARATRRADRYSRSRGPRRAQAAPAPPCRRGGPPVACAHAVDADAERPLSVSSRQRTAPRGDTE